MIDRRDDGCVGLTWDEVRLLLGREYEEGSTFDHALLTEYLIGEGAPRSIRDAPSFTDDSGWYVYTS